MSLDNEEIAQMLENLEKDSKALKKNLLRMCWYMRGGLTYSEALSLSYEEQEIINSIVEDNLATTEKTKLPFF